MPQLTIAQAIQLAVQQHQAGRLPEAEQLYRQVLAQSPENALAVHNLGLIAHQVGRSDIALELIRRAIALHPNYAEAYSNLGAVLTVKGQFDEAIAAYRKAIALRPDYAEAQFNLGALLAGQGKFDEAIAAYHRSIALRPNFAEAYNNLGIALRNKGQVDEAIAAYRRAIALKPNYIEAHSNLGIALEDTGQLDDAIGAHRLAIAAGPNHAEAHGNFGTCAGRMGQLDEAIAAFRKAIALKPAAAELHSSLVYAVSFHPDYGPQQVLRAARTWAQKHADPLAIHSRPHDNNRSPDRPLRIGYVSPYLREQVVGRFLLPVVEHHDHSNFEIVCYSDVRAPDRMTQRIRGACDQWRDIVGMPDKQVAELIRQDGIDILVDPTMHMANNRLLVFARKPAPVQVTWLAYPGTTGMKAMDYRLTDRYLDPFDSAPFDSTPFDSAPFDSAQGQRPPAAADGQGTDNPGENFYSEQSVRLPDCWFCYRPYLESPPVNDLPAIEAGHITFGCLNNFAKVSRETLKCWCGLMRDLPGSRLLLHAHEGSHRRRAKDLLAGEGVDPDRLRFVGLLPPSEYLRLYHQIDICLDPFPYSGGTTSCDSLWMGVPVVTLPGRTAVGRLTATVLHNTGLRDWVADSQEKYVEIARELAGDLARLSQMRSTLRQRMQVSALMDEARFTRNVESAYREVWRNWCEHHGRSVEDI